MDGGVYSLPSALQRGARSQGKSRCRCFRIWLPCRGRSEPRAGMGYLPLPWKNWAISVLADMRTGFPFSVRDPSGLVVGAVDSYRYPVNFDLNLAIERVVTLRGYRFALRGGMDNITNQANPTAVNNVTSAAISAIFGRRRPAFRGANPVLWPRRKKTGSP